MLKKPNHGSYTSIFFQVEQLNSYLETLPCLYYSLKANKKVLPLDDANLATHLLCMCLAKWQTQYNLTENSIPFSTRALLLVLKNIENCKEVDYKAQVSTKIKGDEGRQKMESSESCIPKKPKKVDWTDKHCVHCKKHGGQFKSHNTHDCCCFNKDGTLSKVMGLQVSPHPKKRSAKV